MEEQKVNQLHSEVSDLEKSLNELKTTTLSGAERKTKENEVKDKAEKIKGQIDNLSSEERIDARIVAETERADLILKSCADTLNLQTSINIETKTTITTDEPTASEGSNNQSSQSPTTPETVPTTSTPTTPENSKTSTEASAESKDKTPSAPATTPTPTTPENPAVTPIPTNPENPAVTPIPTNPENPTTPVGVANNEKKGFFGKVGEGLGNMRNDVTTGDKWKEQPGKNLLYVGGTLVTGYALYKGVKGLWNRAFGKKKDKKEESDEGEKSDKKESKDEKKEDEDKPFWKTGWGKFLKWTGIGAGAYYVVHGLKTGKWGLGYLLDWKENSPTSSKGELYDNYTELAEKDPEKYKEYEKFGSNVNTMYDGIWERERQYFGSDSQIVLGEIGDRAKEEKIQKSENFKNVDTRGLVPYSLDNFYGNVDELLSYGGVNKYLRSKNIEEYKQKITSFGADWFDKALVPYLSSFANFATFGILSTDTAQQKMDKYFNGIRDRADDNLEILDLFFRQYTKVLTYMADKKNALAAKKAKDIISVQGYDGESWPSDPEEQEEMINEAINDSDWVEKNLKGTSYGAFMSSSILGASKILEQEGINQNEMTDELREIVDDVDAKTEKLIGGFDNNAFTKAEAKLNGGGSLDSGEKEELKKVADNVIEDLGDSKEGGWLYDTFDYGFELLGLNEADRQMILKESGISDALNKTASSIQSLQSEIFTNPTKENVSQLKKLVGEYTSMKKEIAVALYAIQEAKENKDFGDYIAQVLGAVGTGFGHFINSANNLLHLNASFGDIINVFIGLTISGGILKFGGKLSHKPGFRIAGHIMQKVGLAPVTLVEMGLGQTRWGWAVKRHIKNVSKVSNAMAENLMKKRILEGVLSPRQVASIVKDNQELKRALLLTGSETNSEVFEKVIKRTFGEDLKSEAELFTNNYKKIKKIKGLVSYTNEGIRDGKFLHKFTIDKEATKKSFAAFKEFDKELKALGENTAQSKFFDSMLGKCRSVSDIESLKTIIKNEEFKNVITDDNLKTLKKLNIGELSALEKKGALGKFARKEITLEKMMEEVKGVKKAAEISGKAAGEAAEDAARGARQAGEAAGEAIEDASKTAVRKEFEASIDKAVGKLEATANKRAVQPTIDKLKALKSDTSLAEDEMKAFSKFIDEGFQPKFIPELKKLFAISEPISGSSEKLGATLKKYISEGDYSKFKNLLKDSKYEKIFKNAGLDDVIRRELINNFDNVFSKFGNLLAASTRKAIQNVMRMMLRIIGK